MHISHLSKQLKPCKKCKVRPRFIIGWLGADIARPAHHRITIQCHCGSTTDRTHPTQMMLRWNDENSRWMERPRTHAEG